jgi:hypothetical protein
MKKVAGRDLQKLAHLQDSKRMAGVMERKRKERKFFPPSAGLEFARFLADDDLTVASLSKLPRKYQQLALAAAQTKACVDMSDLQGPRGSHDWWPRATRRLASFAYFLRT